MTWIGQLDLFKLIKNTAAYLLLIQIIAATGKQHTGL